MAFAVRSAPAPSIAARARVNSRARSVCVRASSDKPKVNTTGIRASEEKASDSVVGDDRA